MENDGDLARHAAEYLRPALTAAGEKVVDGAAGGVRQSAHQMGTGNVSMQASGDGAKTNVSGRSG